MSATPDHQSAQPSAALEVESKFTAPADAVAPSFDFIPSVGSSTNEVRELSAIYLDTADLRLTRAKRTLRRRTGGPDEGWHLKTPSNGGRMEYGVGLDEGSVSGEGSDAVYVVPDKLLAPIRSLIRNHPLQPIAQVDNERHVTTVFSAEGEPMAEFCDDHVTALSLLDGGEKTTWREWEIELLGDWSERPEGTALMAAMAQVAKLAGASDSESPSKLATALGDSINTAPVPPQPAELPEGSAGRTVVDALAANVNKLVEVDPAVRRDEWDSVHQMRVATRELRSHMQTFHGIIVGDQIAQMEADLKELAGVLGVARDAEVVAERWEQLLQRPDSDAIDEELRSHLVDDIRKDYHRAHRRVIAALNSTRYLALLDQLDELLANPPVTAAETAEEAAEAEAAAADDIEAAEGDVDAAEAEVETAEDAVETAEDAVGEAKTDLEEAQAEAESDGSEDSEAAEIAAESEKKPDEAGQEDTTSVLLRHLNKAYAKLVRRHNAAMAGAEDSSLTGAERDERFHDVRKAAKKLRYSAEAAGTAGLPTKKVYAACKKVQSVLGDFQDTCTARHIILTKAQKAQKHGESAFGYGVLYQMEYYDGREALEDYPDAIEDVFKAFKKLTKKIEKAEKKAKK